MKVSRKTIMAFRIIVLVIFVVLIFPIFPVAALTQNPSPYSELKSELSSELSSTIPEKIDFSGKCKDVLDSKSYCFYNFAWEEFIALNWPVDKNGEPDKSVVIGESPNSKRVWQTFPTPTQVFQSKKNVTPEDRKLRSVGKNRIFYISKGKDPSQGIKQATRQPLIDQYSNYILYRIRLNPQEAEQIQNNKWQYAACLEKYRKDGIKFSPGSMEIKTAWRIFNDDTPPEEKARYYTLSWTPEGIFDDPGIDMKLLPVLGNREKIGPLELGLIGFHINHKISVEDQEVGVLNPETWTWATFSHIDNTPTDIDKPEQKPEQKKYLLYNPQCKTDCQPNHLYAKKPYQWSNTSPHAVDRNGNPQTPTQVELKYNLEPAKPNRNARAANEVWREKLHSSVWANYYLNGIQWQPKKRSSPIIQCLANESLETYVPFKESDSPSCPWTVQSCIGCHEGATLFKKEKAHPDLPLGNADFSFLPIKFSLDKPRQCPPN